MGGIQCCGGAEYGSKGVVPWRDSLLRNGQSPLVHWRNLCSSSLCYQFRNSEQALCGTYELIRFSCLVQLAGGKLVGEFRETQKTLHAHAHRLIAPSSSAIISDYEPLCVDLLPRAAASQMRRAAAKHFRASRRPEG